jgi:hypothetical protein
MGAGHYCPEDRLHDLNPIEQALSKIKVHLRKAEPRTFRALVRPWSYLQFVRAIRKLQLPQGRRLCVRVTVRCSSGYRHKEG